MFMETIRLKTEIYILKCYHIFYMVLIILVIVCHFVAHIKYLFIYNILIIGFYFGISLYIIIFGYIFITDLIIFLEKYTPTTLNKLKAQTKIIIFVCIINGIILTTVYWLNYIDYDSFMKNCPFNFHINKMDKLIIKTGTDKLKEKCQLKRCFEIGELKGFLNDNNNELNEKYFYLCNFNIYKSYLNLESNAESCNYIPLSINNLKQISYFSKCDEYVNFYICSSKEKRHDKFKMKNNLKCPYKFQKTRIVVLGILFPIIDIIANFSIAFFIYCQYNLIIKIINLEIIIGERFRFSPSSLNSTKDSSVIINNNINNNENVLPQLNLRQTELYISQNLLGNNNKNIKNNNGKNRIEMDVINDKNQNELSESKNELISSKNELENLKK